MAKNTQMSKGFQPDSDVHISYEDQQKINKFAKLNARLEDYKVEMDSMKTILQNLQDGYEELELFENDDQIPYLYGEIFIWNNIKNTQILLQNEKSRKISEVKEIEIKCQHLSKWMTDLKTQLYNRFGNNISLENDD